MSLQTLEWRKLPVRIFQSAQTVSTALDIVYDMLTGSLYFDNTTRVPGSGSAWSIAGEFITGSNTEAVWCTPPHKTELSQSVMFSGKNLTGLISSGSPVLAPSQSAFTAGYLYASCVKNSSGSAFTQWTSTFPFGSGSASTGQAICSQLLSGIGLADKITIYESKEAIALFIYDTGANTHAGVVAGAVIDPEQSDPTSSLDAETDGRLYGIITTDVAMASTFVTATTSAATNFLSQNPGSSTGARFVSFLPNTRLLMDVCAEKYSSDNNFGPSVNYSTLSGKFVKTPLKCGKSEGTSNGYYIGRLRDISLIKNSPSGLVVRNNTNGNIIGFTIGSSEVAANDTIMLNYST